MEAVKFTILWGDLSALFLSVKNWVRGSHCQNVLGKYILKYFFFIIRKLFYSAGFLTIARVETLSKAFCNRFSS
ncbi:hypothetical protein FKM82_006720 [Ascaphus truei]